MSSIQSPWRRIAEPNESVNLSEIMSEEAVKCLQRKEEMKFGEMLAGSCETSQAVDDLTSEILEHLKNENALETCDSDSVIAKVLQCQFDKEYDDELKLVEKKQNGSSKVKISYDRYRMVPEELIYDNEFKEDVKENKKKDWDRFDTNEKELASIPRCGYKIGDDGKMVTKHDITIAGRRNACKVMAFPPEIQTGDAAGFDMKLSNKVFNSLKAHSKSLKLKQYKKLDRKESQATAELGVDEPTRIILFKLINNRMLETVNGIISTGKEAIVLHADCDPSYPDVVLPKECAIKVFKTTLNEFKTRAKYIEADYRFRDHFSKQNPRKVVHMWAEKEMHNLMRIQKIGLNCPEVLCLKKHILIMTFVGKNHQAAPKLKDAVLNSSEWILAYEEVVSAMKILYQTGRLVHSDFSEYNILWHKERCWIIDVSQAVEPDHPNALEFLLRDCRNIYNFFSRKGVADVMSIEELFTHVTGLKNIDINLLEGVRSKGNNNPVANRFEVGPDDARNICYPFDYAWDKTKEAKIEIRSKKRNRTGLDDEYSDDYEFDEMWEKSKQEKKNEIIDICADFRNDCNVAVVDSEPK